MVGDSLLSEELVRSEELDHIKVTTEVLEEICSNKLPGPDGIHSGVKL